jgi:agmatinase
MSWKTLLTLALASSAAACSHHNDGEVVPEHERAELLKKWDQEWSFSGIASFAHLKPVKCLIEPDEHYDIAVIGAPFDTAVSYRPGMTSHTPSKLHLTTSLKKQFSKRSHKMNQMN